MARKPQRPLKDDEGMMVGGTERGRKPQRPLRDDEGTLAAWSQMTKAEKDFVRKREKDELDKASSQRSRPLSSRIVDGYYGIVATPNIAKARAKEAGGDSQLRESIYQDAKKEASRSDEDRERRSRYGVNRILKRKDIEMAKGGTTAATRAKAKAVPKKAAPAKAVPKKMAAGGSTASKRADGCATKGKTKGRFI